MASNVTREIDERKSSPVNIDATLMPTSVEEERAIFARSHSARSRANALWLG